MNGHSEHTPAAVPQAQQAGTAHSLWRSAKPCVWTTRMLTALIAGVEGGTWFRLFDKVFSERNLLAAFQQVASKRGAAGVDHVTIEEFTRQCPENLWRLSDALKEGTYRPHAIRRVHIPKPGTNETRPLGIPTVRDRVVQAAIVNVIEPIFERDFAEQSYGFRPGRGCKDALRRVDQLLKAGYVHVVDAGWPGQFVQDWPGCFQQQDETPSAPEVGLIPASRTESASYFPAQRRPSTFLHCTSQLPTIHPRRCATNPPIVEE